MPRIGPVQMGAIGILLLATLLRIHSSHACKISEFPCRGGALCLPLDKYCDGRDDCGDASDEPKYCTGNSIYYINPRPVPYILNLRWRMRCTRDHTRLRIIVGLCMEMRRPTDRTTHHQRLQTFHRQLHRIIFGHCPTAAPDVGARGPLCG